MTAVDETAVMPAPAPEERVSDVELARAAWIGNAHRLLDYLGKHPDLPLPYYFEIGVPSSAFLDAEQARHAVGAAAELMGVEPVEKPGRFEAGVSFGTAHYRVFATSPAHLALSAEVRRLGVAALEEASGAAVPAALAAEMAPVPRVVPTVEAEVPAEESAEVSKPAKKTSAPRSRGKVAVEKQDGGEPK